MTHCLFGCRSDRGISEICLAHGGRIRLGAGEGGRGLRVDVELPAALTSGPAAVATH